MTTAAAAAQRTPAGVLESLRATPPAARAVLAGVFVNKLGAFLQVFVVLYLTHRGYSAVAAGGALGAYAAGSIAGLLVGGWLSDRLGARRTIAGSMAVSAGLILCVLYAPAYALIVGAVALFGAVGQAYRPASGALLSELTPPERQVMVFAFYRLALNLGTTAAPLIGAALVAVSYRLLFWGEAVAALAYTAIALAALPRGSGAAQHPVTPTAPAARGARVSYAAVLADRRYVMFLAAMLLNGLVYVQYLATLPLAVRHAGYGTALYGGCVAVNGAMVITCELLVTKVVQRWPARLAAAAGLALLGAGVSLYAAPVGVAVLLLATVVWSLGEVVGGPTMFAYPAQAGPPALRGRYIGAAHAMFGLGSAIGPVLGVWAWTVMGRPFWLVCGALSVAAVVTVSAGLRRPEPVPIPKPSPAPDGVGVPEALAVEAH
jgi:MFS family permease